MKIQTLAQHFITLLLGVYLAFFFLGMWNHFQGWSALISGVLFLLAPPLYQFLEEGKYI